MARCNHNMGTYWTEWRYLQGVTSGIMYRDKKCNGCDKTMSRQTKNA